VCRCLYCWLPVNAIWSFKWLLCATTTILSNSLGFPFLQHLVYTNTLTLMSCMYCVEANSAFIGSSVWDGKLCCVLIEMGNIDFIVIVLFCLIRARAVTIYLNMHLMLAVFGYRIHLKTVNFVAGHHRWKSMKYSWFPPASKMPNTHHQQWCMHGSLIPIKCKSPHVTWQAVPALVVNDTKNKRSNRFERPYRSKQRRCSLFKSIEQQSCLFDCCFNTLSRKYFCNCTDQKVLKW